MTNKKIVAILFERITGFDLESILDALGIVDKIEQQKVSGILINFKNDFLQQHSSNPDYETIIDFISDNDVFETLLSIRYNLISREYDTFDGFIKYLKTKTISNIRDKNFLFSVIDDLCVRIDNHILENRSLSNHDVASLDNMHEPSRDLLKEILDKVDELSRQIDSENKLNLIAYNFVEKSRIENLRFTPFMSSSLELFHSTNYLKGFHILLSFAFEGDFGSNPSAFLLYSNNDEPINVNNLKLDEQGLQNNNLSIIKLENSDISKGRYVYQINKQDCYFSNSGFDYDMRPFVFIILGEESMGFATFTVINRHISETTSQGAIKSILPFSGTNLFVPEACKLVWPAKSQLQKYLHSSYTKSYHYLKKSEVDGVISIRDYFLDSLRREVREALKQEYD